jgi:hypothetical protein
MESEESYQSDFLPDYCSSESETEELVLKLETRKKKVCKDWKRENEFTSSNEAEDFVKSEKVWSCFRSNRTEEGKKRFFRCNLVKFRGEQCSASVYLWYESTSGNVVLFRSGHGHDCNNIKTRTTMTDAVKAEIGKLFTLKMKPKAILEHLSQENLALPSKTQLNNHLASLRKSKYGANIISLGELNQWLEIHSDIPEDDNKAFIVSYEISFEDTEYFRYFISSKTMLKMALNADHIHADATYKLVWQGFPVLVIGTTDRNRQFHCFGVGVCTDEKTEDFKFIFNSLKNEVARIFNTQISPSTLISDAAKSIQNSFRAVFGEDVLVIMCWAHMKKNVQKKVDSLIPKEARQEILADIDSLQLSQSTEVFEKASNLFLKKWNEHKEFVKYFSAEWLKSNKNWFEGAKKLVPSTNNALESYNRVMKDEDSLRERVSLSRFTVGLIDWIEKWSDNYKSGIKVFKAEPEIDLELWTSSYQWAKSKKTISPKTTEAGIVYKIPAHDLTEISEGIDDWETFDKFKINGFQSWTTILPKDQNDWIKGECNCPSFFKKMLCKHIVGLAIRLKLAVPPPEAKNVPIGTKRKRGRPAKAKKALLVQ